MAEKTNAARVVLELRIVQTLSGRVTFHRITSGLKARASRNRDAILQIRGACHKYSSRANGKAPFGQLKRSIGQGHAGANLSGHQGLLDPGQVPHRVGEGTLSGGKGIVNKNLGTGGGSV
jgi:hypothetical protein